jgi:hypothetical protein
MEKTKQIRNETDIMNTSSSSCSSSSLLLVLVIQIAFQTHEATMQKKKKDKP